MSTKRNSVCMYLEILINFEALTWGEKDTFQLGSFFGYFNKFKFLRWPQKFAKTFLLIWILLKSNQMGDFVNFFGLLRKPELWYYAHFIKSSKLKLIEKTRLSYLWKTEGEVSLEGLRNLVVLANEVAGLWLEKVDGRAANVGTGVDTVEVVLLVVLAVLELEAADVKPPKSVLGVSWNPVVEVGTVGTVGISRVISRFCGICKSTRGLSGPNWEVTANAGRSVGVSCCVSCWVKTGVNRLALWATGTGGGCGKAAAEAVNKFWLFVRNWLKRAKLEADVDGGGPVKTK